jgi:hypothetical protein
MLTRDQNSSSVRRTSKRRLSLSDATVKTNAVVQESASLRAPTRGECVRVANLGRHRRLHRLPPCSVLEDLVSRAETERAQIRNQSRNSLRLQTWIVADVREFG